MIHGNIAGVRESMLAELEKLYDQQFGREDFLPDRLLSLLVRITAQINREVMVYLTRDGEVLEVSIGSISSVGLPERHLRRNTDRLSGIRCIHTHPGGNPRLSDVDEKALRLLRFDAMCAVGVEQERATGISAAFLGDVEYGQLSIVNFGPVKPGRVPQQLWMREIELADRRVQEAIRAMDITEEAEKAVLISVDSEESLDELQQLASTAGAVVAARVLQSRARPDRATYIGSGKAEEIALLCQAEEIDLAIIDDELTGAQQRNLEDVLHVRVVDRTTLILDIFAARAQSREGKLQVELAQMKYRLPRLMGLGVSLSRLGGGIGTRGPGETRLEVDRRRVRRRIDDLSAELQELRSQRDMRRARRRKEGQSVVALVGYTNAGKSTLLNALSGSSVFVADKLFATLDPVVRNVRLPGGGDCLVVDTVGFIRKLPHALVEAFKSTLEEALYADLLVVVSDAASPHVREQRQVVSQVLEELGAQGKPVVEAFNKADLVENPAGLEPRDALWICARRGEGIERLKARIEVGLRRVARQEEFLIPYDRGAALSFLHERARVLETAYEPQGTRVTAVCDAQTADRARAMIEGGPEPAIG